MIGFIGLGQMGSVLVDQMLSRGLPLRVFDLAPEACERFARSGIPVASSAADAAKDADLLFFCLPDGDAVTAATTGVGGVLAASSLPRYCIDCSSSAPSSTRALAAVVSRAGSTLVDAPVTGGVTNAKAGRLSTMIGSPPIHEPLLTEALRSYASTVEWLGEVGAGHGAKAVNNGLSALSYLATTETVLVATRLGYGLPAAIAAINDSPARSQNSEVKFPRFVTSGSFDAGFTVSLLEKDLGIAGAMGAEAGLSLPVTATLRQLCLAARAVLGTGADFTRLYELLAGWCESGPDRAPVVPDDLDSLITALEDVLRVGTSELLGLLAAQAGDTAAALRAILAGSGRNEVVREALEEGVSPPAGVTQAAGPASSPAGAARLLAILSAARDAGVPTFVHAVAAEIARGTGAVPAPPDMIGESDASR
jgi:3-hydroxyisobutyrate dehydrogenase